MADRRIVECRTGFAVRVAGTRIVCRRGDLYFADDPVVKGREDLFSDVNVKSSKGLKAPVSATATETASAAPGERRRMSRKTRDDEDDKKSEAQPAEAKAKSDDSSEV